MRERDRNREVRGQRQKTEARRRIYSDSEESSEQERARSPDKGKNNKKTGGASLSDGEEGEVEIIATTTAKRGRPPTTGDYKGIREEKEKFNREKEVELKLLHEERLAKLTGREIILTSKTKVDVEEVAMDAELNLTHDIINRIREHQAEVWLRDG